MSKTSITEWIKEKAGPVGTLFLASVIIGASIGAAARAHADPAADAYAEKYGLVVCNVLDKYPTFAGITGIAQGIHNDGLSYYQAGNVIGESVSNLCPQYVGLLKAYVKTAGTPTISPVYAS